MRKHSLVLSVIATVAVTILASCGSNYSGGGTVVAPPVNSSTPGGLLVSPATATVPIGLMANFKAYIPSSPSTTSFTWALSGTCSSNGAVSASGVYTAPTTLPTPSGCQVTVTATSGSVSGTATLTIAAAQGVVVGPAAALSLAAGASQTFAATVGGIAVTPTWEVNGNAGGGAEFGFISAGGVYTAPLSPPPGGSATITAVSGVNSGTASVTIYFSGSSFSGPYVFSYAGDDGTGFLQVIGNFTAQGSTNQILSGSEDAEDGGGGANIAITGGTFSVGPDGRTTATLSDGTTWQFTLIGNSAADAGKPVQHALLVRFDAAGTGSGTIDQQDTAEASAPFPAGNYAFDLAGLDSTGVPLGAAGKFFSNGAGLFPLNSAVWDVNDGGVLTLDDPTLSGGYAVANTSSSQGRGTLLLSSTNTQINTSLSFVFYVVDNTHAKLIETDGRAFLSGDIYSGPTTADGTFTIANTVPNGNYAFTVGGSASAGPYTAGGVFDVTGTTGSITAGVLDANNGGSAIKLDVPISSSILSVDPAFGRATLGIRAAGSSVPNFEAYKTGSGSLLLVEMDSSQVATGVAYPQTSTAALAGNYALNLTGEAAVNKGSAPGLYEQDVNGQLVTVGGTTFTGTLDINNFALTTPTPNAALVSGTTIVAADTNGRGTLTLETKVGTFQLAYYIVGNINDSTPAVLLMEIDGSRVMVGQFSQQY